MDSQQFFKYISIVLLGTLLFVPFLGHVHLFDWDEINFAECAREMLVSKDYLMVQIDFQPFWEKPPLFIWMQALSMKIWGVNEMAARFPNAIIGIITLMSIYYVGKKVISAKMAQWWVLIYAASWLPHFYFKSGIIDPTFNYFIFLAFFQVHLLSFSSDKWKHAFWAGLFLGLAVLTKGPVAALIAMLAFLVYVVINRGLWSFKWQHLLGIVFAAVLPFGLWFGAALLQKGWGYGSWFMQEFIDYQIRLFQTEDADHGGPFVYHFIVLLLGCFPASIFLFQFERRRTNESKTAQDFTRWMWILFWVTLILFSIVKTKIVHYSSLCYYPLTYLAAFKIDQLVNGEIKLKSWLKYLMFSIAGIWSILLMALPFIGIYKEKLYPFIDDPFAVANLHAAVSWTPLEALWGLAYLVGIIVAVQLMKRKLRTGVLILVGVQMVMVQVTMTHFTPKIEAYSQRAAINYFQSLKGKDVYIHVLGYKSYAPYFYASKQPQDNPLRRNEDWLLHGKIDKPVYFICKITSAQQYEIMPELVKLKESNGFVFFKRDLPKNLN